jgi:hypothetical protein
MKAMTSMDNGFVTNMYDMKFVHDILHAFFFCLG